MSIPPESNSEHPPPLAGEVDSDSAFLLLSTEPATSASTPPPLYALPRPRSIPLLATAGLADLVVALYFTAIALRDPGLGFGALFLWGLARPFVVLGVISSVRVRERSWVVLAQVVMTALVCLYHFNELIQTRRERAPHSSPPTSRTDATAAAHRSQSDAFVPETRYIIVSLAFSVLHYALFAIFIGIRRRSNPFVGRRAPRGVSGTWAEQAWLGSEESVRTALGSGSGPRGRTLSSATRTGILLGVEEEELYESDDGEDASGESESDGEETDQDDIIDIPIRGGSMRRQSRLTLRDAEMDREPSRERTLSNERAAREATVVGNGDLRASTRFGSIKSLEQSGQLQARAESAAERAFTPTHTQYVTIYCIEIYFVFMLLGWNLKYLPAGYIGSSTIGAALIFASFDQKAAKIASVLPSRCRVAMSMEGY
ncbi:hypothetical protein RQP46_003851 [Phenoliferia psychrophenolica]